MYKQVNCPICNELMIGEFMDGIVIYKCPTHSYSEPTGEPSGVHLHVGYDIDPKLVFKSLRD